ncbi:putative aminotransferase [uncultured delta proteobacterium]|uniref:Putative aminotransferase n=1 Tax=uncultured delta proteobacterium TaxID=34034 RepID=A0A212K338_9DELT|nr:putative aminotransferase [uncultured delta proteobacterium]
MPFPNNSKLMLHRTPKKDVEAGRVPVIVKGEGLYVEDSDGNRYLEMDSGLTRPVSLGYGNKEVAQAVYDQILRLSYFTPCGWANEPAMELAEKIAALAPGDINHVTFECSGSEAVESAMKLAKLYHFYKGNKQRFKAVSRVGAYHGANGLGLRAMGLVLPMRLMFEPSAPGGIFVHSPYCYRCPYKMTYPNCDMFCVTMTEEAILREDPDLIAAFIGETIQQGFGSYSPVKEYWPLIREMCDKHDIVLIMDEVICGFGRTGKMFGIEHFGVVPDIMTMAKCLSSGYVPLGAVGVTDKINDGIENFMHLHTYGNHPVGCAASLATIAILERDNLVERAADMGAYLLQALRDRLGNFPSAGEIRGQGLWVSVDFTTDKKTRPLFPAENLNSLVARALRRGVIIKGVGSAVELAPSFVITTEQIDEFVTVFAQCIEDEEKAMGLRK